MKRLVLLLATILLVISCNKEQPTVLSVSQTSLASGKEGGAQTVVVSANKIWTASSDQSWCKVSPSSGDGSKSMDTSVSITCEANQTSESRTCSISVKSEEKQVSIVVKQDEGDALLLSQTEYEVSSEAQVINLNVRYNVEYDIEVDAACKDWVSISETKALSTQGYTLTVAENDTYESRKGKVIFKQRGGNLSSTVTINQAQNDALIVEKTQYELTPEAQQLNIKVKSNVQYDVRIDADSQSWISQKETKALTESTLCFSIAMNDGDDRTGKILLTASGISTEITVLQAGEEYVVFEDSAFERFCVESFDLNGDGRISIKEASVVDEINLDYVYSLSGIEYFVNLVRLTCQEWFDCDTLDLSKNTSLQYCSIIGKQSSWDLLTTILFGDNHALTELRVSGTNLEKLDVSTLSNLQILYCPSNKLTSLDISNNPSLEYLDCTSNQITALDVSNHTNLINLDLDKNPLISINASNTGITYFSFRPVDTSASIESINLSHCPLLERVNINATSVRITNLDLSNCPKIKGINRYHIDKLNLSSCPSITSFRIEGARYKEVNLSNCSGLQSISGLLTELDTLDLSDCTALTSFPRGDIRPNDIGYSTRPIKTLKKLILNNCTSIPSVGLYECGLTSIEVKNCTSLTYLHCENNQLTSIDVSTCPALQNFSCAINQLTTLDVSNNSILQSLTCGSNQLISLDVSNNPSLEYLDCSRNKLTSLDVSKNSYLDDLRCEGNQLTVLDVSNNLRLSFLRTSDNPLLTEIWLKTGQSIHWFQYDSSLTTIKYRD